MKRTAKKSLEPSRSYRSIDRPSPPLVASFAPETLPLSSLYLHLSELRRQTPNPDLMEKYIARSVELAKEMTPREQVAIFHLLGSKNEFFLNSFYNNLKRSSFIKSLSPMDLVIALNTFAKEAKSVCKTDLVEPGSGKKNSLIAKLLGEIPMHIPKFENHHLAQVFHSLTFLPISNLSNSIVSSLVEELVSHRSNLVLFNPQSILMISTAMSRLNVKSVPLWTIVLARSTQIRRDEMQANWPDVLLTNVSMVDGIVCDLEFLTAMTKEVLFQYKTKMINTGRVDKAATALLKLGASNSLIAMLRNI